MNILLLLLITIMITINEIHNHDSIPHAATANLRASILDFGGFGSSRVLMLRDGFIMSIGTFVENLSRAILVEIIREIGIMSYAMNREPWQLRPGPMMLKCAALAALVAPAMSAAQMRSGRTGQDPCSTCGSRTWKPA